MELIREKTLTTQYYDLDWNRHVTSRTYERFGYDARMEILSELGFPIHQCLENNISYISDGTYVRFLSQQFAGSEIKVITKLMQGEDGLLYWKQDLYGADGKKACEMEVTSYLSQNKEKLKIPKIPKLNEVWRSSSIKPKPNNQLTLDHAHYIPFSEMTCFWNLPSEAIWKVFEEGRFLFFKEIVALNLIKETDATTFFMGGEIKIFKLPEPGSKIKISSWIESVEKIRFYFRQNIVSEEGEVFASMKDEQLFVALSTSRPRKAPPEFLAKVERFIEKKD
ncbi:acyl-[acyl-carrier-protein] thioesterase [Leptospira sp. 96542]|nr:acyl-[acyl-carrier-protein] thioesterase [Leptospira sp. 96542]